MRKLEIIGVLLVLFVALNAALGQDNGTQQPSDQTESNPQEPVPAFGTENPAPVTAENPPISGLDLPNLEPHAAPLSYLQLGAHGSESLDSNIENEFGGSGVHTITRALGSLDLRRLWSHYDLGLDYLGGIGYYAVRGIGLKQIEEVGLDQKVTWKRGQLAVRDAFSYQPEGTFGSAYGSVGATGAGLSGVGTFFGGTALGALGQVPRIMNLSAADVVENLSPKSSITAAGAYGIVHFLGNDPEFGNSFIGSNQTTAEVAYDRVLGPHDQAAIMYAYQGFNFSTGTSFHSHIIQLMWGHRISGRMDFLISAGPQFTVINTLLPVTTQPQNAAACVFEVSDLTLDCPTSDLRISAAGRATLRYRFPKTSLSLSYEHFITSGSGFFAGAESDIAHVNAERPFGRIWTAFTDIGYSRNSRVEPVTTQLAACTPTVTDPNPPACPGVIANTYSFDYAGGGVRRMFGRSLQVFASYQFNYLTFDSSYCQNTTTPGPCNRISTRHVGTIGLDWTPRPVRID